MSESILEFWIFGISVVLNFGLLDSRWNQEIQTPKIGSGNPGFRILQKNAVCSCVRPAAWVLGVCVKLFDLMHVTRVINFMYFFSKDVVLKVVLTRGSKGMLVRSWCFKTTQGNYGLCTFVALWSLTHLVVVSYYLWSKILLLVAVFTLPLNFIHQVQTHMNSQYSTNMFPS